MKLTKFTNLAVMGLILTIALAGCRKRPEYMTNIPGARMGQVGEPDTAKPIGLEDNKPKEATDGFPLGPGHEGWKEDAEAFKADTVHFDFDSSVVKSDEKPHVAAVADQLKANPSQALKVEGHCDERGTEEYNRALGERRALALREQLIGLGIDPARVDTISYGKDRPEDPSHDEAAWKKNRRGVFVLLSPQQPVSAAPAQQ